MTSGSEWNPNTVKLGKVSMDKNDDTFELQRHVFGFHSEPDVTYICVSVLSSLSVGTCDLNPIFVPSGVR